MQQTSLLANEASKPQRENNYDKIIRALKQLPNNEGVADSIAAYSKLDKTEVSRRTNEMARLGMIHDTGRKGMTAKACKAIIWKLSVTQKQEPETLTLF